MLVNRENLLGLQQTLRVGFLSGLANAKPKYRDLVTVVPSTHDAENYAWLGELPKMKEWLSDRELALLSASKYSIENKKWANGIRISRDDIEDDNTGMLAARVRQLAEMAEAAKDELIMNLLISGFTEVGYDGQYFFDTDHGESGDVSNKGQAALDADAFMAAFQAGEELVDANGEPYDVQYDTLVVGPALRAIAEEILLKETIDGDPNLNFRRVKLIVSPRLVGAAADYWFLLDTRGEIKPLILQERRAVQFRAMDNPEDEHAFMRDEFRYGADGRWNAGFGPWQLAYGSDGTS